MRISKLKVLSLVFLVTAGLMAVMLGDGLAAGKRNPILPYVPKRESRQKPKTAPNKDKLILNARSRVETFDGSSEFKVVNNKLKWSPSETAIIICDMWDQHWCKSATRRVAEMAPRMNRFIGKARKKGVLIVHAPSGTVDYYKDHPARKRAESAPKAANLPTDISRGCRRLEAEKKGKWPIDQSDGGCDCEPKCKGGSPWRKQVDTVDIRDEDAITDSGVETWNLFEERGIKNVILVGVHTNMCVVGRPFGLRNMAKFGKNVVLCRDLTDTMYNPRMWPYVSHFSGTDLVIEHIEKFICPTITSTVFTGQPPFRFKNDKRPLVVFISAESEYDADRSLPELAHELEEKYGLCCEILQSSTKRHGEERNDIPGMQVLIEADLAVLFVRRRALPAEQMKYFRDYLNSGKPLIALRTSSHAFAARGYIPKGLKQWSNFDREVLGCHYKGYWLGETLVTIVPKAANHAILKGLRGPYQVRETIYKSRPLAKSCQVLMMGRCVDGKGDNPRYRKKPGESVPDEPIAWVNTYKGAKIFYTSMGNGRAAFRQPWFRGMIINAIFWAMDKPVPKVTAKVEASVSTNR